MFNNSYMNNQYNQPYNGYVQPYMAYQQYQNRQPMQMQQPQQEVQQDIPFSEVRYGTLDQAKGYIVLPNRAVMFIDQDKSEFYINRADSMGKPFLETYKYYPMNNLPDELKTKPSEPIFDGKPKVNDDFLTKKDAESFLTQKDLEEINKKLEQLQKKVQISKMIKEGDE